MTLKTARERGTSQAVPDLPEDPDITPRAPET